MRFVASVDPVDNEETKHEKQVASFLFCSVVFFLNSVLQQADWLYLTGQQLFCLDLIQLFFLQQMQNDILQMLSVIHGDFYGVRFSQRNRLCILNAISFLPEAAHEHTFYRRPWRDKDTITHQRYSNNCIINPFIAIVCSRGGSFFLFQQTSHWFAHWHFLLISASMSEAVI